MLKAFRTVAVLGAGIMGSQIAAHLANAGLSVHLLDRAHDGESKNHHVEAAFKRAMKLSPPIFFTDKIARRITLGNFDQHFDRLKQADWVIEVIIEDLAIKQEMMARIEAVVRPNTIVSTNTSGLPVAAIAAGRSEAFRRHFLGTHFFNPPRYLKLLELIPTEDTAPSTLARVQEFGAMRLGKGIVIAKDTPNFVANRIGVYATMLGLQALEQGYTIAEIDTLTGILVGRPKSATFRTADLVGLDTLSAVLQHLHGAIPQDESPAMFAIPDVLRNLVAAGALGAKTKRGFYQKVKGEILALDPRTMEYALPAPIDFGPAMAIAKVKDLGDRLRLLYKDQGRAGQFFRNYMRRLFAYCINRIPEITDDFSEIDRALRWGFGWQMGPFAIWDRLGFSMVLADMESHSMTIPAWVMKMKEEGAAGFYTSAAVPTREMSVHGEMDGGRSARSNVVIPPSPPNSYGEATPTNGGSDDKVPLLKGDLGGSQPEYPNDHIDLDAIKADHHNLLWRNAEAALLDLGDGVALYEFRSKGNTLSMKVLEGLDEVMTLVERGEFRGLVIGNGRDHFCGGANLMEMAAMAQADMARFGNVSATELVEQSAISGLIEKFQGLLNRIYYSPYPVVAAVQGRSLGGGAELVLACPKIVAAAESYIGLVEVSVGLIPGAGGIMRMVSRATHRAATETPAHILPFLKTVFETIATAKVSSSALEAQELGFLPDDAVIIMDGDRRLDVAKAEVLRLDQIGYVPPAAHNTFMVLGKPGRAMFDYAAYVFEQGGFATAYDRFLAGKLAYVMTGGDLTAPTIVPESYLLDLEKQTFVPLLQQPKTQARIESMLTRKKPLRN
ncbi:enoyl-CoA hydratase/isomerase family protein [filamentous cyanobacterium LEGE 11480]|uniref:Enoyl-CoA hydratase/isomerase family protein n=1 Tax=Romeriopsis navalis LEGE 11480 TaxID=2777977 RepID=A0A928Z3X2_9CYAN|nr:3-hydroxyacyl-CoA dehydrogenase/enoyl-CoA hydratase family protein [Romeriopsis navalis]MBE9031129.1 enoyl-CoA hydratase/isomerase family protein [Romeriopsis navalis LEGE 11480]